MKGLRRFILAGAAGLMTALQASAADITLFDYAFNIDGSVTAQAAPAGVNLAAFDTTTGLGSISVSLAGAGSHYVALFVDHEIDETINTFFNEFGATSAAAPGSGQSWEIDEPGYVFGDIFTNFSASALDGGNGVPGSAVDDVSMAMGWDFNLAAGQTATISFLISTSAPVGGFYLQQTDPDSNDATFYLSSFLRIGQGGQAPEPTPLLLVGLGLLGAAFAGRRSGRC